MEPKVSPQDYLFSKAGALRERAAITDDPSAKQSLQRLADAYQLLAQKALGEAGSGGNGSTEKDKQLRA